MKQKINREQKLKQTNKQTKLTTTKNPKPKQKQPQKGSSLSKLTKWI